MRDLAPPSKLSLAVEPFRAAAAIGNLALNWRSMGAAAQGDGHPVMLLPGLGNTDWSNTLLRRHLQRLGYRVQGWGLGANLGARAVGADAERLIARVERLVSEEGEPVTLIGISLGGILARLVAQRRPDLVRDVITIASPFAGPPTATNVWRAFEWLTGEKITDPALIARLKEVARPLPVPMTAIWSRSDGFVNGRICRPDWDENCHAVEVRSGHLGVHLQPEVLRAVAAALAGRG